MYLVIIYRLSLYDITDTAVDSLVQTGATGFASFDFKLNYLGSNQTAKDVFPELNNLTVDLPISGNEFMAATVQKPMNSEKPQNHLEKNNQQQ